MTEQTPARSAFDIPGFAEFIAALAQKLDDSKNSEQPTVKEPNEDA